MWHRNLVFWSVSLFGLFGLFAHPFACTSSLVLKSQNFIRANFTVNHDKYIFI